MKNGCRFLALKCREVCCSRSNRGWRDKIQARKPLIGASWLFYWPGMAGKSGPRSEAQIRCSACLRKFISIGSDKGAPGREKKS
jgi:hypothetical protein